MKKIHIIPFLFFLSIPLLNAQMYPDRHNTNWFDGWISCTTSVSPNATRGDIHWVMYDLGYDYPLGEINLWNCNIPDSTDMGLQNIIIDYSKDGLEWEELGNYTLTKSLGSSIYQGEEVGTFNGQTARFILINGMTNYGGDCYSFSEFRVNVVEAVVPIQLISFEANCTENYEAELSWSTTNEINNDFFLVQKSNDGVEWTDVGTVKAMTVPQETNHYQFIDNSENQGTYYYQLVQYDLDGYFTVYPIASVACDKVVSDIALYPNPAENKIQVFIESKESELLKVRLINAIGEEIRMMSLATNNEHEIILEDLPNGHYYLWVYNGDDILKEKFVKVK